MNKHVLSVCFILGYMETNEQPVATGSAVQTRDILWKGMMEDLFADFLLFFLERAADIFDISRGFEFMDKELDEITPGVMIKHPRLVDKLVKVWYKNGTESWLLVHIEVQGYKDKHFPERMFTYFYRIRDRYRRDITSLVIFTDNDAKYHPCKYEYDCCGTRLVFYFNTYKILDKDVTLLEQSNNPFAMVVLTILTALKQKDGMPERLVDSLLVLIRRLLARELPKHKIARLVTFIKRYVYLGNSELFHKFEEEIKLITGNPAHMGIYEQILQIETEEAEERGKAEGKAEMVRNLLINTGFDIETIAHFAGEPVDFVIKVKNGLSAGTEHNL